MLKIIIVVRFLMITKVVDIPIIDHPALMFQIVLDIRDSPHSIVFLPGLPRLNPPAFLFFGRHGGVTSTSAFYR